MSHVEFLCPNCHGVLNRSKKTFSDNHFHPLQKIKCRDCGHTTKWYDMIERRRTKALSAGVGEGGSLVAPTLQQVLFATGGREINIVDDHDDDSVIAQSAINTAAGTHDSSDLTYDAVNYVDGFNAAASGHMEVIYTMESATFTGTIDFVRWRLRAQRVDSSGNPTNSQITPMKAPSGFGATYVIISKTTQLNTALVGLSLDVTTDPVTNQPWTLVRLNDGNKYGFQLDLDRTTVGSGEGVDCEIRDYEFQLEVWGH